MSMILYHGEPNGPSLTALVGAFETGAEVELRPLDLANGARHALAEAKTPEVAMSIEGEGPVLVADGTAMSDAFFIALFFDEAQGGDSLRPTEPYARWEVMMWCRYVTERIAPAAAYLGTRAYLAPHLASAGDEFDAMVARIRSTDLAERWRQVRANAFVEDRLADSHAKIAQGAERCETALAQHGGDWLLGDFSIADIESYAWLASMPLLSPAAFEDKPLTTAWMDRVAARPSVARALATASVGDPRQIWSIGPEINRWG